MKILVAINRVLDPQVRVKLDGSSHDIDKQSGKSIINPFCEIALEEAVRLKERGQANEVVVVSVGDQTHLEQLRTALALGADRAIHVQSNLSLETLDIAKILARVAVTEAASLVLLGKQSVDRDQNHVGQMLAGLCKWPQATFASKIEFKESELIYVSRELDSGSDIRCLHLPAVVTVDLRLNTPRYPTMPNIMKARQKPLSTLTLADLGVTPVNRVSVENLAVVPVRKAGLKVSTLDEFVEALNGYGVQL